MLLSWTIEENTILHFTVIHIIEIPTNKGANSYKLDFFLFLEIGNTVWLIILTAVESIIMSVSGLRVHYSTNAKC